MRSKIASRTLASPPHRELLIISTFSHPEIIWSQPTVWFHFLPVATCNRDPWVSKEEERWTGNERVQQQPPSTIPQFHNEPIVPSSDRTSSLPPSSKRLLARRSLFAFEENKALSPSPFFNSFRVSPRFSGDRRAGNHNIFAYSLPVSRRFSHGRNEIDVSVSYHVPREGSVAPFLDRLTLDEWTGAFGGNETGFWLTFELDVRLPCSGRRRDIEILIEILFLFLSFFFLSRKYRWK